MKSIRTKKKALKIVLVLVAVLLAVSVLEVTSTRSQNQNTNLLVYPILSPNINTAANQLKSEAAVWGDETFTNTSTYSNLEIILNGNLTIANGGSLTLINATLRVNCTANGSNRIEVKSGGALYINDSDGNPSTKNDASNITAYNPSYRFLFWVDSGATFQMNNSELHYCGYDEYTSNSDHYGLWINTNDIIFQNNILTNNHNGIILYNALHNKITNNTATNNTENGFTLVYSSNYNTLTGNTAANNTKTGFYLFSVSYSNLTGNTASGSTYGFTLDSSSNNNSLFNNTATGNHYGFILNSSSNNNTLSGNTATSNTDNGFTLVYSSDYNTLTGNTATDNPRSGFYVYSSSNNTLTNNTAINNGYGFDFISAGSNTLKANTAINSTNEAYYLDKYSVGNDLTGSVAKNYLRINVLDYFGNPVAGAEVIVEVDGNVVYASPGFGGSNSTTDENGLTEWILVTDQTYLSGTVFRWNKINVTVNHRELPIINNPRIVTMSKTRTETFILNPPSVFTIPSSLNETILVLFITFVSGLIAITVLNPKTLKTLRKIARC